MGDSLLWAIKNGDIAAIKKECKDSSFDANSVLSGGRCPIHFAADYGQTDVIEFLVSKGADVNLSDKHGITPLLAAIYEEHVECVKILLQKGAKKSGKTPDGLTYLDCTDNEDIKALLK